MGATPAPHHTTASASHHANSRGSRRCSALGNSNTRDASHRARHQLPQWLHVSRQQVQQRVQLTQSRDTRASSVRRVSSVHGGQLLPQALQQVALKPASVHPTQAGMLQLRPLRQRQPLQVAAHQTHFRDKLIEMHKKSNKESLHLCRPKETCPHSCAHGKHPAGCCARGHCGVARTLMHSAQLS